MGRMSQSAKPTRADLLAAVDRTVPDIIRPTLKLLFVGINPGLYTAWAGYHFAHPGNRFWPALYAGGLTPTLFKPEQNQQLLDLGFGITNMVARPTIKADELSKEELIAGGQRLVKLAEEFRPQWIAVLGTTSYRVAFNQPKAQVGPQDFTIGPSKVWLLTNPSGLNAHYTPAKLAEVFGQLRQAIED
jgi:TDG/mug DNA glycosylase family protein